MRRLPERFQAAFFDGLHIGWVLSGCRQPVGLLSETVMSAVDIVWAVFRQAAAEAEYGEMQCVMHDLIPAARRVGCFRRPGGKRHLRWLTGL